MSTLSTRFQTFKEQYFPERQLFLRSEGRVSFIKLGSRTQMTMVSSVALLVGWMSVTSFNFLTRDLVMEDKNSEIAELRADYQDLDGDYYKLDAEVNSKINALGKRQEYLEGILEGNDIAKPVKVIDVTTQNPPQETTPTTNTKTSMMSELFGGGTANASVDISRTSSRQQTLVHLRSLTEKQLVLAGTIHQRSIAKINEIEAILKNTSVKLDRLVDQFNGDTSGMGGPYIPEKGFTPLFTKSDNAIFDTLKNEILRLDIATSALDSFPTGEPAAKYYVSSRFGGRTDPFTKRKARHPGLDMAGWPGTAIQAATDGVVITAGTRPAYGLMVEIDHGNGFHTRYGHMKKLRVKKGENVILGQRIGDMGKTGRATSSHLHYEVWFEGKVVDPLPFIKAAQDVRKIQGRYESS